MRHKTSNGDETSERIVVDDVRSTSTSVIGKGGEGGTRETIVIPPLRIGMVAVRLVGDSELIVHQWSEKAKREMRDKQMKLAKAAREPKDPEKDYRDSLYMMPDGSGYGFPTIGIKSCAVDACSCVSGVTKVAARGAFHIQGDYAKIEGTPYMREDMVRLSGPGSVADIRYRGAFPEWQMQFVVRYNQNILTPSQIFNLFNAAGFSIGLGEWRPAKDGQKGMFHVAEVTGD